MFFMLLYIIFIFIHYIIWEGISKQTSKNSYRTGKNYRRCIVGRLVKLLIEYMYSPGKIR